MYWFLSQRPFWHYHVTFSQKRKTSSEKNLNEITITLPLLLAMRLCAAGESTAHQNKKELIQGSSKFLPLEQDCVQVQQIAQNLLDFCEKGGAPRNLDRTPVLNFVTDGLFNMHLQHGAQACSSGASTLTHPVQQGISVYITSMPSNLNSGIQPQDLDKDTHYEGDTRHLLTDSHPLHINEPVLGWGASLRDLLWTPPMSHAWIDSPAFGPVQSTDG